MPRKSKGKSPITPVLLLVGLVLGFVVGGSNMADLTQDQLSKQSEAFVKEYLQLIDYKDKV